MRVSILIGLCLVAIGMVALYQVRNGFLMSSVARVVYAPPAEPEALRAAFDELADTPGARTGFSLGDVAKAREVCALRFVGSRPGPEVLEAFRRLNLMLLGAGVGAFVPVVDPEAHHVAEIRRSLARDTAPWRESSLSQNEVDRLTEALENLTKRDHPVYADLGFADGFKHYDLRGMSQAMRRGGADFQTCVEKTRDG